MSSRLIHGICTYYGQWLIGDLRGFRSRDHRIHSSGDYKDHPPVDEHAALRVWVKSNMKAQPVVLNPTEFPILGAALVYRIHFIGSTVRCLSCGPTHVHLLYDSIAADSKKELARAKQYASLKLETHPGRVWADDCSVDQINDIEHARNLWTYILDHARKEGAWVWRYDRDAVPTRDDIKEMLKRCRAHHGDAGSPV